MRLPVDPPRQPCGCRPMYHEHGCPLPVDGRVPSSGPHIVGEPAGERLMRSQAVERAVLLTGLTPSQVAAVLHGLADHTALMAALDYSRPEDGYWPEATSLGRWLHDTANQLEDRHGRIQ